MWLTTNCGKFLKKWEYQTTLPASWETRVQAKKQQLKLDHNKWTSSKLGKDYIKAVFCHPAYLTYMQVTSCKMPGWMKHKLDSRFPGEISKTSDMQMTLFSLLYQHWTPFWFYNRASFCLITFVLSVASAWNVLPPYIILSNFFPLLIFYSNIIFIMTPSSEYLM